MSQYSGSGAQAKQVTTADAAALASKGRLVGLAICPTGAVTPTITVYDNASAASGNVLFGPYKIPSGQAFAVTWDDEGVEALNGVFVHADSWTTLAVNAYVKP